MITRQRRQRDRTCRELMRELDALMAGRRNERLRGGGAVLGRTQTERRTVLRRAFGDLLAAGFTLQHLTQLSSAHINALISTWRTRGLAAGTICQYAGCLRGLCRWLGKPQLGSSLSLLIQSERADVVKSMVPAKARQSTASVRELFVRAARMDGRFVCVLLLMAALGLTARQAWLSCPWLASEVPQLARVRWRMRYGHSRDLTVNDAIRAVIVWAQTFAATPTSSMVPPADSLNHWRRKFYRNCRRIGLTRRQSGLTPQLLYYRLQCENDTFIGQLLELARGEVQKQAPGCFSPEPQAREGHCTSVDRDAHVIA